MSVPPDSAVPPLSEQAVIVAGRVHDGRPCRVVDNAGTVDRGLPEALPADLVEARGFGLSGLPASSGTHAIRLGAPDFTHIRLGEEVHRLILFPCEARLEAF
jgi:hypothetical protein